MPRFYPEVEHETLEVQMMWRIGMSIRRARAFCDRLNDTRPVGVSAVLLAEMVTKHERMIEFQFREEIERLQETIDSLRTPVKVPTLFT
jgi:hypothetical protein